MFRTMPICLEYHDTSIPSSAPLQHSYVQTPRPPRPPHGTSVAAPGHPQGTSSFPHGEGLGGLTVEHQLRLGLPLADSTDSFTQKCDHVLFNFTNVRSKLDDSSQRSTDVRRLAALLMVDAPRSRKNLGVTQYWIMLKFLVKGLLMGHVPQVAMDSFRS